MAAYFAYTAISGYDPLTGHSLSPLERGLAILPALSEIARGVSAVLRTSEALGEASAGLRLGSQAAGAAGRLEGRVGSLFSRLRSDVRELFSGSRASQAGELAGSVTLSPSSLRLSQSSVNGVSDIAESMRASGWMGDPIDVVRMPDGGLTSIDNARVVAAHQAGIDVQAQIYAFDEVLPEQFVGRFTTAKGGTPSTWGEAIMNRIGGQSSTYRNNYPLGSPFTSWDGR